LVVTVVTAAGARAADAAGGAPAEKSLLTMLLEGGPMMGVLACCSVLGLAWAMMLAVAVFRRRWQPPLLKSAVAAVLGRGDADLSLLKELIGLRTDPLSNVLRAVLALVGRPLGDVTQAFEDAAACEVEKAAARIRSL